MEFYDWENFRKNYKQTHSQQKIAGASVTVKSLELKKIQGELGLTGQRNENQCKRKLKWTQKTPI